MTSTATKYREGNSTGSPSAVVRRRGAIEFDDMSDDIIVEDNIDQMTENTINNNNNNANVADENKPLKHGCVDVWTWSKKYRSQEVVLSGASLRTAFFHPNWSKGTAGVRGTKVLNNGRYYWEIHVTNRIFGTSMMFGIGTAKAQLHANCFKNLLGEDNESWGLSHKGQIWHGGIGIRYTKCFKENQATTVGLLFDGIDGTLTYYKDGQCLGVAFRGLNKIHEPIYPIVCSTAAKTEMILAETRRDFVNLQDRCRAEICKLISTKRDLWKLKLPPIITEYLAEGVSELPIAVGAAPSSSSMAVALLSATCTTFDNIYFR